MINNSGEPETNRRNKASLVTNNFRSAIRFINAKVVLNITLAKILTVIPLLGNDTNRRLQHTYLQGQSYCPFPFLSRLDGNKIKAPAVNELIPLSKHRPER